MQVKIENKTTLAPAPAPPSIKRPLPALPALAPLKLPPLPEVPEIKSRQADEDEDTESPHGHGRHGGDHDHRELKGSRDRSAGDHSRSRGGSGGTPVRRHAVPGERVWSGMLCKTHSPDVRAIAIHMSGSSIKGMVPAQLDIVGRISYEVNL